MANHPHQTPIVAFLGSDAGQGGPFALLGLLHEIQSDQQVYQACNRRLQQIDFSRHRSTPDAAEVRLAIHAAASQLLDPTLRKQLAMRWPPGVPASVPKAWKKSAASTTLTPRLVHNAKLLIAGSGGWNPLARKRLAHFARVNRLSAIDVVNALIPKKHSGKNPDSTQSNVQQANLQQNFESSTLQSSPYIPRHSSMDIPPTKSSAWFISYMILFVAGVSIAASFVYSSRTATPASQVTNEGNNADRTGLTASNRKTTDPSSSTLQRESLDHYTAIAHEFDVLSTRFHVDPAASIERFPFVYESYAKTWIQFPPQALERSSSHIAVIVKQIAQEPHAFEWASLFARDSLRDPLADAIQAASLDVILSDPELPSQARTQLFEIRKQYPGIPVQSRSDVVGSLGLVLGLLAVEQSEDSLQWWKRWIEGVKVIGSDQQDHLVLSAMSARLHDSTPSTKEWERSAIELVQAVSWNDQTTREWLLRQLADETVQASRLAAITVAVAVHSGAEHVDATMVLNPSFTFIQRQPMADRYRIAWARNESGSAPNSSASAQSIADELRILVASTPVTATRKRAIQNLIDLTQNNAIAWELIFGDSVIAQELGSAQSNTGFDTVNTTDHSIVQSTQDTNWAQQAVNAKDLDSLTLLCAQLNHHDLSTHSAFALVHLATIHADSDIRALAIIHLLRLADHPAMLLALDHAVGGRRITNRLASVIEQVIGQGVPNRNDEQWFFIVHQKLLIKLASAQAQAMDSDLSNLEHALGIIYHHNLPSLAANETALAGLLARYQILEERFQTSTPNPTLQTQHSMTRASLNLALSSAPSSLHQFAAYQASFSSLLGIITQQTFPGSGYRVQEIQQNLVSRLANADTLIDQMVQYERAAAELFVIWLGSHQVGGSTNG